MIVLENIQSQLKEWPPLIFCFSIRKKVIKITGLNYWLVHRLSDFILLFGFFGLQCYYYP